MKRIPSLLLIASFLLAFIACGQRTRDAAPAAAGPKQAVDLSKYSVATFAAGCFWHEEAMFESVKGVEEAVSGYAGGTTEDPTYEGIETGNTGHAETVNVYYDSTRIDYPTLLKLYLAGQDPTSVNGQGPDRGTQYRSLIFYRNSAERQQAEGAIAALQASGRYDAPIAVQVVPFVKFWKAEEYHQDFIAHNPDQGYVNAVSIPEIKKVQREFPQLIKPDHLFR